MEERHECVNGDKCCWCGKDLKEEEKIERRCSDSVSVEDLRLHYLCDACEDI